MKEYAAYFFFYCFIIPAIFFATAAFVIFFVIPVLTMETWGEYRKKSLFTKDGRPQT